MPSKSQRGRKKARRRLTAGPCAWCETWCDPDLPVGDPRKATWDHLVPQSHDPRQGYERLDLMVRACARCNSARGNRPPSHLGQHADRTSRAW